jgi:hypothetical protein
MKTSLVYVAALLVTTLATAIASAEEGCPPVPNCSPCPPPAQNVADPSACDPCGPCCSECPMHWWEKCGLYQKLFCRPKCAKADRPKPPKQPNALGSPVFPTHPYLRSPRDFFMLD